MTGETRTSFKAYFVVKTIFHFQREEIELLARLDRFSWKWILQSSVKGSKKCRIASRADASKNSFESRSTHRDDIA